MRINFVTKGLLLLAAAALFSSASACNAAGPDKQKEGSLSFEPAEIGIPCAAWEGEISVTADCDWGVYSGGKEWCSVYPSGGVAGTTKLKVSISENALYDARQTELTFRFGESSKKMPVRQEGKAKPDIPIPEGYSLDWCDEFNLPDGSLPDTELWRFESKPAGWVNNERQTGLAIQAQSAMKDAISALKAGMELDLVTLDLQRSWEALREITGKAGRENLLDEIFSRFCLGK